jgi:hypothetical protein
MLLMDSQRGMLLVNARMTFARRVAVALRLWVQRNAYFLTIRIHVKHIIFRYARVGTTPHHQRHSLIAN